MLAGFVLVKATTMGLALLSMTGFALQAIQPVETVLSAAWITLAVTGSAMSAWFFSHCQGPAAPRRSAPIKRERA